MNKYMLCLLALIWVGKALQAQTPAGLKIGDSLPDFTIPKMIQFEKGSPAGVSMKFSELNADLLIIDFWSTWCSGCIEALPKMDSLQKTFGKVLKILPVTIEGEQMVTAFWKRNRNTKELSLPTVVEDRLFEAYFPHKSIPHEVWIYKGKVIAITTAQYVDASNIRKVLSGAQVNWPVKNDFYVFDPLQPLFQLSRNYGDKARVSLKYAAISGYKEGINSEGVTGGDGIIRDSVNKTVRAYMLNQAIFPAYLLRLNRLVKTSALIRPAAVFSMNQVVWEVEDKNRYRYDPNTAYQAEWIRKNGICFEALFPDTGQSDLEVMRAVLQEMNSLLGLNVGWEKRKEKVFDLVVTDKARLDKHKSRKTLADPKDMLHISGKQYSLRSFPLSTMVYELNRQEGNPYIFDQTGYAEPVDLDLTISSWSSLSELRTSLHAFGLDLVPEEREVDKLVFTERKRTNVP